MNRPAQPFCKQAPAHPINGDGAHRRSLAARLTWGALAIAVALGAVACSRHSGPSASNATVAPWTDLPSEAPLLTGDMRALGETLSYRAGTEQGRVTWLETTIKSGSQGSLRRRYQFKDAFLVHYQDSEGLQLEFDSRGRPVGVQRNGQPVDVHSEMSAVNAARNQAALLRSSVVAEHDTRLHRQVTRNDG